MNEPSPHPLTYSSSHEAVWVVWLVGWPAPGLRGPYSLALIKVLLRSSRAEVSRFQVNRAIL